MGHKGWGMFMRVLKGSQGWGIFMRHQSSPEGERRAQMRTLEALGVDLRDEVGGQVAINEWLLGEDVAQQRDVVVHACVSACWHVEGDEPLMT